MYLKYLQIVNFKNLRNVRFEFDKGVNTVTGENDSGKSNAMTAMRVLLDNDYYYNEKRLKETDFCEELGNWKGHWIIVSAFFDEITPEDKLSEVCAEIMPENEDAQFLKSYIRCRDYDYGVITVIIRPNKSVRKALFDASSTEEFNRIRDSISLKDYEFLYTARSQADFTDPAVYKEIVGDLDNCKPVNPEDDDSALIGSKVNILDIWRHVSLVYIDALRDAHNELRKPKNPLRRIFDVMQQELEEDTVESIRKKVRDLNQSLAGIPQIKNIGVDVNKKLNDIVGLVYSPEISIESHIREEIESIARNLSVVPAGEQDIEQLGLGHLNILYIALKLVEFEANRNHEILNIMIVEEPEAHIHTHIQRTLFDNLNVKENYTQVIMTTHSTHISEVSKIKRMNVLKREANHSIVMHPANNINEYGKSVLKIKDVTIEKCIERYLDAKRSVLLFSKAVILVEGDGEEFLIPALIRQCFGVSLDELGIGLINVGSVSFEYIAGIFSSDRLRRRCAIITDLDAVVDGALKSKEKAAELGRSRKEKLDALFYANEWVDAFYAPHTLEVDFYNISDNKDYIKKIIQTHYSQEAAKKRHIEAVDASESQRYDSIITVVNELGKGWHSILLAESINSTARIPEYIIRAIAFVSQDVVTHRILKRMGMYVLSLYDGFSELSTMLDDALLEDEIMQAINRICNELKDDVFSEFVMFWKEYREHE